MKENLTELVFILDRSGSMSGLEDDTIGGFNSLIEKQKSEDGEAVVTTVLFSDTSYSIHDRKDIKEIKPITRGDYIPHGCTALLDAVGQTIDDIVKEQNSIKEEEKPSKTMFVITTDGMENASYRYSYEDVRKLVSRQEEQGWEFVFLGANIDAVKEAGRFGIREENAVDYKCDSEGIELVYDAVCCCVSEARENKKSKKWREDIDRDFKERGEERN